MPPCIGITLNDSMDDGWLQSNSNLTVRLVPTPSNFVAYALNDDKYAAGCLKEEPNGIMLQQGLSRLLAVTLQVC